MPGVSKSLSNEASIDYNYLNKVVAERKKEGVNANPKEVKQIKINVNFKAKAKPKTDQTTLENQTSEKPKLDDLTLLNIEKALVDSDEENKDLNDS